MSEDQPLAEQPSNGAPAPPQPGGPPQFITTLKSIEQQVGENVIRALQSPATAAVLTTVVLDPSGQQHMVSMPLSSDAMQEIQKLLRESAAAGGADSPKDVPCVGFHCRLRREDMEEKKT